MLQTTIENHYKTLADTHKSKFEALSKKHVQLSIVRLIVMIAALALFFNYATKDSTISLIIGLVLVAAFVYLMKIHQQTAYQRTYFKTLQTINEAEYLYLTEQKLSFENGKDFQQENHAYSSDLDLFGDRSLYQHINRTATQMGRSTLAKNLLQNQEEATIKSHQQSVQELSTLLDFRQDFYALGKIADDNADIYSRLLKWAKEEETSNVPKPLLVAAYVLPIITMGAIVLYFLTKQEIYWNVINKIIPVMLFIFFGQFKNIKKAMFSTEKINEMLKSYGAMLQRIEASHFESSYLQKLQSQLATNKASQQLQELGKIFSKMETIQNPFSAFIMNGLFLYHIHQLNNLNNWKQQHRRQVQEWLQMIGSFEMLQSLANLKYNNPSFCFPEINHNEQISFETLGHPLIPSGKRISNDISFHNNRYIILTGSNMSGKSTFLRTLGVNMILAGMGAPVCATAANIHPMKIFVSMRQSDSLADSESYFFAEVKRLKFIMDQLNNETCFVLLDEILRGTNSDDKRSGTIGVIEKIIQRKTIGAIATHDLEVCLTTDMHPDILINKCFEVEIINNELVFDYKLRNGICKNKSATFLMKKMEII